MKLKLFHITFWLLFSFFVLDFIFEISDSKDTLGCEGPTQAMVVFRQGADSFADTIKLLASTWRRDPYINGDHGVYPPIAYLLVYPLKFLYGGSKDLPDYEDLMDDGNIPCCTLGLSILLAFVLILATIHRKEQPPCKLLGLALVLMCSSVVIFSVERANLILISAIGAAVFLNNYNSQNKRKKLLAAGALAIAATFKFYPAILGIVWLNRRDLKFLMLSGSLSFILGTVPLLFFQHSPFENICALINNLGTCTDFARTTNFYTNINLTSYLALFIHTLARSIYPYVHLFDYLFLAWSVICAVCAVKSNQRWQREFLLASSIIYLSPFACFYTALYFIPSIVSFFCAPPHQGKDDCWLAILFAFMLTPFQIPGINPWIHFNFLILADLLFALSVLLVARQLWSHFHHREIHSQRSIHSGSPNQQDGRE